MAANDNMTLKFIPMTSILKSTKNEDAACSDWVATEKVHGSNFQFFTDDGNNIHLASRRTILDRQVSFLKCNLKEYCQRYVPHVKRLYETITTEERWQAYRTFTNMINEEDEEAEEEGTNEDEAQNGESGEAEKSTKDDEISTENIQETETGNESKGGIELRVYGELYGGGGIKKDLKSAVQKEIIYTDEFRFYVFGININRKWTTVLEMNDLCQIAEFPYYAVPVCPPKSTIEELKQWLQTEEFMKSTSRLADKIDFANTMIEGVVMTPLTRQDFKYHAIKLLASAFNDVRVSAVGRRQKLNFCTKARYNSVLSKLDLPERENADMVVEMFIADIIKEAGEAEADANKRKAWKNSVRAWLIMDGYLEDDRKQNNSKRNRAKGRNSDKTNDNAEPSTEQCQENPEDDDDDIGGLFG